ncbi:hypothetical protein [uncultured Stenotrophomonas sp.]|uniref:hypothetical protein n=1 Tax=uncultured Stenotrophomonas sp. TaxID=165438 RepID=UPI0028E4A669|nr:hypothetical protein [uncultured Stenotrophomonas sp.]
MTFRRHLVTALQLAVLVAVSLPAAAQDGTPPGRTPAAGAAGLRMHLRVIDACRLPAGDGASTCATAHQRSDTRMPPPQQVQALTPPAEGGQLPRAWQTITF